MKKNLLLSFLVLLNLVSFATEFRNVNSISGTYQWNAIATWQSFNGSSWVSATNIPSTGDNVTLRGISGGCTINIPSGTFQINDLTLPNSINLSLVLQNNSVLEMTGSIRKQGTTFGTNMITSGSGTTATGGRIKFIGTSRDIAPNSDVDQINNYGIRNQIKNWICEIALNPNETASSGSLSDFKCGRFILSSGNFELPSNRSLLVDRNSAGDATAGTDGLGSININAGSILISDYIGRRTTSTTFIGPILINDGATLILRRGGQGSINGETITVNGTIQFKGNTTPLSECSTCSNGNGNSGVAFGTNSTLIYDIPSSVAPASNLVAMGAIVDRSGSGNTVNKLKVITQNDRDRLLTTQTIGAASFSSSIKVADTLDLSGKIEIGSTNLETVELLNACKLINASTNHYIVITSRSGAGMKGLKRTLNSNETLLFPVAMKASGTIERFTPFQLTNNAAQQSFSFSNMEPDSWAIGGGVNSTLFPFMQNNFASSIFNSPSLDFITANDMIEDVRWDIDASSGSGNITMKVGLGNNVTIGGDFSTNPSHYIFHNNGAASPSTWTEHSATYTASDASIFNLPTLTGNYNGTFSPFGFGSFGSIPLPLNLLNFNAESKPNANVITWSTTHEINMSHFDIEKSTDGINFSAMGQLNAKNELTKNNYTFTDNTPSSINYYRIRSVDLDGSETYSSIIMLISNQKSSYTMNLYPNPVVNNCNIQFDSKNETMLKLSLTNLNGQMIFSKNFNLQIGINNCPLNLSSLPDATYYLKIENHNGQSNLFKLTKLKY